jgi:hypothetical protein
MLPHALLRKKRVGVAVHWILCCGTAVVGEAKTCVYYPKKCCKGCGMGCQMVCALTQMRVMDLGYELYPHPDRTQVFFSYRVPLTDFETVNGNGNLTIMELVPGFPQTPANCYDVWALPDDNSVLVKAPLFRLSALKRATRPQDKAPRLHRGDLGLFDSLQKSYSGFCRSRGRACWFPGSSRIWRQRSGTGALACTSATRAAP